eukprot:3228587-Pleurochrysis_carterae.AAC.1
MDLSEATRERDAYVQRSSGATGNTRGRRVPATVSVGVLVRIIASVPAARSSMVSSDDGGRSRRFRSSSSNSASRQASRFSRSTAWLRARTSSSSSTNLNFFQAKMYDTTGAGVELTKSRRACAQASEMGYASSGPVLASSGRPARYNRTAGRPTA